MNQSDNRSSELPGAFSLFRPSWEAIRLNLVTFIELVLVPLLVVLVSSLFKSVTADFFRYLGEILAIVLSPAVYITQLRSVQNKTIDFSHAVQEGLHIFWRFIGLEICMFVIIIVGFILLIVPGFFMIHRYILAPYYLIDHNMKIVDALKASATDSKKFSGAIWGLIGVEVLLIVALGILDALLGPLAIIAIVFYYVYYCAPAIRYLQIKHATKPNTVAAPIV
jgi:hypothetical protein